MLVLAAVVAAGFSVQGALGATTTIEGVEGEEPEVKWRVSDSKGNTYVWSMPITTYEDQIVESRYHVRDKANLNLDGETIQTVSLDGFVKRSFADVIDGIYDNSHSNSDFIWEVWYIVSQLTVYDYDIHPYSEGRYALETLTRGGGDCEDLTILIADMLLSSEHTADWTIQYVFMDGHNPTDPQEMNHAILYVHDGEYNYFIEATGSPSWEWYPDGVVGWFFDVVEYTDELDFSGQNLSGMDLRNRDFSGAILTGADLSGADLSFSDLRNADLSGANLQDANLYGAYLWDADLSFADLYNADLRRAVLGDASLVGADLSEAKLGWSGLFGADLTQAILYNANMWRIDASGAVFADAFLFNATMSGANLYEADLSGAQMGHADLSRADLSYANLELAILNNADLDRANMQSANLNNAVLGDANLYGVSLIDADLRSADLRGANLYSAELVFADLRGANIDAALNVEYANFLGVER